MVEITAKEQSKVKRMKRSEDSLRDLWDNIKCSNSRIIGVSEEEEKEKGYEKIFEEMIVENFPNMEKEIVNQVQEAQRVPYRINPKRNMPRHILPRKVPDQSMLGGFAVRMQMEGAPDQSMMGGGQESLT